MKSKAVENVVQKMRAFSFSVVRLQAAIWVLIGFSLASCNDPEILEDVTPTALVAKSTSTPKNTPPAASEQIPGSKSEIRIRYGFPTEIDPNQRYLFYLHGKIIEDQGLPAISSEYGEYKYVEILDAFQSNGLVVISEQRPRDTDPTEYARDVSTQMNDLLKAGVPPGSITVAGASKGAAIATLVSNMVANPEVNYVLLGACNQPLINEWRQQDIALSGNVLAIYDFSDIYAVSCQQLFTLSEGTRLRRHAEIVLQIGTGHGILYEPLVEWVLPTVKWANQEWESEFF
jgi:hypothetical protein